MTLRVTIAGLAVLVTAGGVACAMSENQGAKPETEVADPYEPGRQRMVTTQIEARGIKDERVLEAVRQVPRHLFVPEELRRHAYADRPLPIGHHQTISQPYIVALMTELVRPRPGKKILEIGTGSGYQAAVLAECAAEVYTIEIVPELGRQAQDLLAELGYDNVHARIGDGFDGWPDEAPFDAMIVTAAPSQVPQPLLDQLAVGGRLVIPVGEGFQNLIVVTRTTSGFERSTITPVRFVPMTGKAQQDN
jgi:protein-L-isoaspartate(D-aspartate) O-methyltransferase